MLVAIFLLPFLSVSCAAIHSLQYLYTASSGMSDLPEFISVGKVDGVEVSYYDSKNIKEVPKQHWMSENLDEEYWISETNLDIIYREIFKKNIFILKQRFNQTEGVHVFQKRYGCQWNDETDATDGFEQFGYDGEDFMSLHLKDMTWMSPVPQAASTVQRWNREESFMPHRKDYFQKDCVDWLKKYVNFGSSTLGRKVWPEVSLFQKAFVAVCHATGFYPEEVMITWKRNGEKMEDDVDVGETLPNEDGTFQKRAVLTVSPKERKKHQYSCEVTHKSGEPTVLMFHEEGTSFLIIVVVITAAVLVVLLAGIVVVVNMKKKKGFTMASQSEGKSDSSGHRLDCIEHSEHPV